MVCLCWKRITGNREVTLEIDGAKQLKKVVKKVSKFK